MPEVLPTKTTPARTTSGPPARSFSARGFETYCLECELWFTFEMGSLLSMGIDPASLRWFDAPCPRGHTVRVTPADVWELVPNA